jgi:Na+/melibiose symporter-like transporter
MSESTHALLCDLCASKLHRASGSGRSKPVWLCIIFAFSLVFTAYLSNAIVSGRVCFSLVLYRVIDLSPGMLTCPSSSWVKSSFPILKSAVMGSNPNTRGSCFGCSWLCLAGSMLSTHSPTNTKCHQLLLDLRYQCQSVSKLWNLNLLLTIKSLQNTLHRVFWVVVLLVF